MSVGTEPDCIRNSTFGITHYYNVDVDRGFTSPRVKWFAYDAMIRRLMLARSVVIAVPPAAELQEYSPKADRALPAAIYGRTSDAMFLIAYFVVLRATVIAPTPPIQRVYTARRRFQHCSVVF
jgi:hypothetical protein